MSHTQEPWRIEDDDSIYGGDDFGLLVYEPFSDMLEKDDLIRIVACVNACAGVATETLEALARGDIPESEVIQAARYKQQRDELKEKLSASEAAVSRYVETLNATSRERDELQATADRFAEIMADKDRQLIAVARKHNELLAALELIAKPKADFDNATSEMELDGIRLIASVAIEKVRGQS